MCVRHLHDVGRDTNAYVWHGQDVISSLLLPQRYLLISYNGIGFLQRYVLRIDMEQSGEPLVFRRPNVERDVLRRGGSDSLVLTLR